MLVLPFIWFSQTRIIFMRNQLLGRIARYRVYLQQGLWVPDEHGEDLTLFNFNYDYCVKRAQEMSEGNETDSAEKLGKSLKLNDEDLEGLWIDLEKIPFNGEIDLSGQAISDKTLIRLSNLIMKVPISGLYLSHTHISEIGGQNLGKALARSSIKKLIMTNCRLGRSTNLIMENLEKIHTIDFGELGNNQLRYLANQKFQIQHMAFQEDQKNPWDTETKSAFLLSIPKSVLSVTLSIDNWQHKKFIGQVEIRCQENRRAHTEERRNEFKQKDLNPNDPDYYESDDFDTNAFKFSVKSYLSNVFESLLDESLYYLEKERQNVLRDDEIYKVTKELLPKLIMEDICTADGSIIVLAKYLLSKIKK